MNRENIGIGIVGISGYGATYPRTLKNITFSNMLGVCDINADAANAFAKEHNIPGVYTDFNEMLKNPEIDVVFIATPHFLHYSMVMASLQAGKHVFCEKPLALNYKEASEMAQTAKDLGLTLSCHYNQRLAAQVKALKDIVSNGTLGDVYHANVKWMARFTRFMFDESREWRVSREKAGGGILIGRGSHMLDAIWYVLGKPRIKTVYASITSRLTGLDVEDYSLVVLTLENGGTVHLECSYEANTAGYFQKMEYELLGTKAGAMYTNIDGTTSLKVGHNEFPTNRWVDSSDRFSLETYQCAPPNSVIEDFLESLRDGREPLITADEAVWVTRLLDAAYLSAAENRVVELTNLN